METLRIKGQLVDGRLELDEVAKHREDRSKRESLGEEHDIAKLNKDFRVLHYKDF